MGEIIILIVVLAILLTPVAYFVGYIIKMTTNDPIKKEKNPLELGATIVIFFIGGLIALGIIGGAIYLVYYLLST